MTPKDVVNAFDALVREARKSHGGSGPSEAHEAAIESLHDARYLLPLAEDARRAVLKDSGYEAIAGQILRVIRSLAPIP